MTLFAAVQVMVREGQRLDAMEMAKKKASDMELVVRPVAKHT